MRNKPRCGLFTCALTILGALLLTTTLLLHNYVEKQYHALRGPTSRQAALRDARGAAAALVDAVATRPPGEAIVRGAGNATDLEALIWGNASTCADEMRSLSFVSEECGWTPGQDLVDDFLGAATVLGIDIEVSNDALKGIAAFYSYRRSSHSYRDGAFTFVPCCKCASESFSEAFRSIQKKNHTERGPFHDKHATTEGCTFAFTRDPISHFRSGYIEMEWRFRQGLKKIGDRDMGNMTFHQHPLGSAARVEALLRDLLSLSWYRPQPPYMPRAFAYRAALAHVLPVHGSLAGYDYDFIGDVSSMNADFAQLKRVCLAVPQLLQLPNNTHKTSSDPWRLKSGINLAMAPESEGRRAFKRLFRVDYELYQRRNRAPGTLPKNSGNRQLP